MSIFDVLGVKKDILAGKSAELISRYRDRLRLVDSLRQAKTDYPDLPRLFPVKGAVLTLEPSLHVFSDTILLISEDDSFEASAKTLLVSWRLMQSFMTGRLPLRGGIAFGDMQIDDTNQLHMGRALTEAHLQEASQAWAGCVIAPSVFEKFPLSLWANLGFDGLTDVLFPIVSVPFKKDSGIVRRTERAINWRLNLVFDTGFATDWMDYYRASSFGQLHPYLQESLQFAKQYGGYIGSQEKMPLECRTFWVGRKQPPFENGDDY